MITPKMKEFLESLPDNPTKTIKYCVYLNRIQKRVDRELNQLFWLCRYHPQIFLDEEREWHDKSGKIVSHRRLKKLLLCLKVLNPNIDVELVLKNLKIPEEK